MRFRVEYKNLKTGKWTTVSRHYLREEAIKNARGLLSYDNEGRAYRVSDENHQRVYWEAENE